MKSIFAKLIGHIIFYCTISIIILSSAQISYADETKFSNYPVVQTFIEQMVIKHGFDKKYLTKLFDKATPLPDILEKMQHPYEAEPWYQYRAHFLTEERIKQGVKYWHKHREALTYAEQAYGVPASVIVAIVGVETNYGKVKLKYPVLDTLITLSFYYPPRAAFFQTELEQYLLLTRELDINPRKIKGSYAGAIGLPQFMPSNYRTYALPYWNIEHAKADIINNTDDVIVSVANFLHCFGWQEQQSVAVPITTQQLRYYSSPQLMRFAKDTDRYEYWLGLDNFAVISHYNSSKQYVLVVYQLSELLKQRYQTKYN